MKQFLVLSAALLLAALILTPSASAQAHMKYNERLIKRLDEMAVHPERAGNPYRVYIVDGFRDIDVDAFLNTHFANMQNVMFTNVIITDKNGSPKRDKRTGSVITEDDGC